MVFGQPLHPRNSLLMSESDTSQWAGFHDEEKKDGKVDLCGSKDDSIWYQTWPGSREQMSKCYVCHITDHRHVITQLQYCKL